MGVAGSLHPSRRETGVLRQHSRTVAAATMAAEEARRKKEPAAHAPASPSIIPAVPTSPPQGVAQVCDLELPRPLGERGLTRVQSSAGWAEDCSVVCGGQHEQNPCRARVAGPGDGQVRPPLACQHVTVD